MGNLPALEKHEGPGPHPGSGSSQEVHGGGDGGKSSFLPTQDETRGRYNSMRERYDAWYKDMGFNKNDHRALESYIGSDYNEINEALRGGWDLGEFEDEVAALDDITAWGSAPADAVVFRGTPLYSDKTDTDGDMGQVREMLKAKMDDPSRRFVFYDQAFLSTSMNWEVAHDFATYEGEDAGANPAIFKINIPKGAKCAAINPNELEVLFPRNTKFEITEVKRSGPLWLITMTPFTEGK
jgi:hypothetical protein